MDGYFIDAERSMGFRHLLGHHDQKSHGHGKGGIPGLPDMFGFVDRFDDLGYLATDVVKGDGDVDVNLGLVKWGDNGETGIEIATPRTEWDPSALVVNPLLDPDGARQVAKDLRELADLVDQGVKGKPSSRLTRTHEKLQRQLANGDVAESDEVTEDLPLTFGELMELLAAAAPKASGPSTRRVVEGLSHADDSAFEGDDANVWMELDNSGTGILFATKEGDSPWSPIEDDFDDQATAGLSPGSARALADKLVAFADAADKEQTDKPQARTAQMRDHIELRLRGILTGVGR